MEQSRIRSSERPRPAATAPLGGIDAETAVVRSGPYEESLPVVGMTVQQVRSRYGDVLDVDPDAQAFVDGREADESTPITEGQHLVFAREAGEKGVVR